MYDAVTKNDVKQQRRYHYINVNPPPSKICSVFVPKNRHCLLRMKVDLCQHRPKPIVLSILYNFGCLLQNPQ